MLIVACFAYVTDSITSIMLPVPIPTVSTVTLALGGLGELAIVVWMIVVGAKTPQTEISK
jgi:hypothetical protein